MNRLLLIVTLCIISPFFTSGQVKDTITYKGQLSAWGNYNQTGDDLLIGGRYIPQLNYSHDFSSSNLLGLELSANIYGNWYNNYDAEGKIKPYRAWVRYSSSQLELRAGLQKINFGSATLLRPLMWFDQMDPHDPLQLTDGVWGVLGRYYFLNNANIWLWGLYGNNQPKGWEVFGSHSEYPEIGGRMQLPIGIGEAAASFHHRKAKVESIFDVLLFDFEKYSENRIGLDTKIDWIMGIWFEGVWINSYKNIGLLTNQTLLNAGMDYTFGIGNGLLAVYEHLLASSDVKPFDFASTFQFSLLSLSYPIGIFDNVGTLFYYSWNNQQVYSFLNWQRTYNRISLHLLAYWNPKTFELPQQNLGSNFFGGKGVQFMFVFNH